jgi:DNA-binding MarR family transcriptional regulator
MRCLSRAQAEPDGVMAIYDLALAEAGLKGSQLTVLVALANREKVGPSELARLLETDESTVSHNVERCARRVGCIWIPARIGEATRSN